MSFIDTKFWIFGGIVAIGIHLVTTAYFENIYNDKAVYYPSPSHVNSVFVYQNIQYTYKRLFNYKYFFINIDIRARVAIMVELSLTDISQGYVIFFSIKNKLV